MGLLRITKTTVDELPLTKKGQIFYRDNRLNGFGVCIGKTAKTYYAEKRINGKTVRTGIGRHGQITPEFARREAQILLGQMTVGENPNLLKQKARTKGITLEAVFDEFLQARKNLKKSTVYEYRRTMKCYFSDWLKKAIVDITKDMVMKRHVLIGERHGKGQANLSMRILRSLVNFAMGRYEASDGNQILFINPVSVLSKTRSWYRIDRRRTVIKPHELPALFKALDDMETAKPTSNSKADVFKDYLLLLLFTGLRRNEGMRLKWQNVDFKAKVFTITDTKNNEPLTLPMSDFLLDLFQRRHESKTGDHVFPGDGESGHITEPKWYLDNIKELSGLSFSAHDLRRTFASIAGNIIPAYALKALLNHKMDGMGQDVTAGYYVQDAESLRPLMQKITNQILRHAKSDSTSNVIAFPTGRR